jgi:flagellar L-ring protein precursor FlgH
MIKRLFTFYVAILLAAGCVSVRHKSIDSAADTLTQNSPELKDFFHPEESAIDPKLEEEGRGSLWVSSYTSHLYDNMYRARRIGDTVVIVIDEKTRGSSVGNTIANRKSEQTTSADNLGGLMEKLGELIAALDPSNVVKASSEGKFQGIGQTSRNGNLVARMTATVARVLKNGNMIIRGKQEIVINKEKQVLMVEGIIRPWDIRPDNTVLSSSVAEARISYSGFGVVGDKQSPGWLVRLLDTIWPF